MMASSGLHVETGEGSGLVIVGATTGLGLGLVSVEGLGATTGLVLVTVVGLGSLIGGLTIFSMKIFLNM